MIADRLRALAASWSSDNGDPPDTDYQRGYMAACAEHAREVDQILAEDAGGWRSMDSAPKDGTRFLWCSYNETGRLQWFYSVIRWPEFKECFTEGWWRPLPEPPPQEPQS